MEQENNKRKPLSITKHTIYRFLEIKLSSVPFRKRNSPVPKLREISSLLEDLQLLNKQSKELYEQSQRLEIQKTVLDVILYNRNEQITQFLQFTRELQCLKKLAPIIKQPAPNIKPSIILQREICDVMKELKAIRLTLIQSYLEKEPNLHERKLEMWGSVESLLINSSPDLILKVISNLARIQADHVESTVKSIQVEECNKYLSKKESTVSEEIAESVNDLLIDMCAKHVTIRMAVYKRQYAAKCAEAAALVMKSNAIKAYQKRNSDEKCNKYAEDVINAKLDVAGSRAALSEMSSIRKNLDIRIEMAKMAEMKLVEDYRKIAEFDDKVETALVHIKGLETNQWDCDKKINKELDLVHDMVSKSINTMFVPTPFTFIVEEMALYLRILKNRVANCVSICSLGPNNLDLNEEQLQNIENLCSFDTTWENLLFLYLQNKQINRNLMQNIWRNKKDADAMNSALQYSNFTTKHAKDLLTKCEVNDEQLTKELTPLLDSAHDQLSTNYKKVFYLKTLIEDWWKQPCRQIEL